MNRYLNMLIAIRLMNLLLPISLDYLSINSYPSISRLNRLSKKIVGYR